MIGEGKLIGDGDNSGGVGDDDVYRGNMESMLVLSFNLYSNKEISISANRPSSYPTLYYLLTTSTTALKNSI